jgi:hypothetical protein
MARDGSPMKSPYSVDDPTDSQLLGNHSCRQKDYSMQDWEQQANKSKPDPIRSVSTFPESVSLGLYSVGTAGIHEAGLRR